jgi:hypothetical protein
MKLIICLVVITVAVVVIFPHGITTPEQMLSALRALMGA